MTLDDDDDADVDDVDDVDVGVRSRRILPPRLSM